MPSRNNDPERTKASIPKVAGREFSEQGLAGARIVVIAETPHGRWTSRWTSGSFRAGIDPIDRHLSIGALSVFNVANEHTFSVMFKGHSGTGFSCFHFAVESRSWTARRADRLSTPPCMNRRRARCTRAMRPCPKRWRAMCAMR